MPGNEYTKLRQAYDYWDSLSKEHELKESAHDVVKALLINYNDSCKDSEDELAEYELKWLFGEE